jgi:hypothetical protein
MPHQTKAESQATLAAIMATLCSASAALDKDPDDEMMDQPDSEDADKVAEILFLAGIESLMLQETLT